jgi:phasin family protein
MGDLISARCTQAETQDPDYMADFDENSASTPAKLPAVAAAPADKSSPRRKVVGRGQTSLSSPSPMVLPGATKSVAQSPALPEIVSSSPAASPKPASDEIAKDAPVASVEAVQPAPTPDVVSAPRAETLDGDVLNAGPEAALKRPVGRPRKVAVGASAPVATKAAAKPDLAKHALGQRSAAKPSLGKPIVAKPHPIEPTAKPTIAKARRIKAAAVPQVKAPTANADLPAGKVAASIATTSRPALRAARIMNSVPTPNPTPPSAISIKDLTMDMSANFNGFQGAMSEAQAKAQAAFEKSSNMMGEAGDFAKGNVEALVESTKIFAEGVQEIGSTLVAEGRTAFESMTGDIKELAAAKSPTDFLKLQSDLVRKNFDTAVSYSSKSSESFLKLMSDAFAPLSGRVSLAVEKARQVAPLGAPTNVAA